MPHLKGNFNRRSDKSVSPYCLGWTQHVQQSWLCKLYIKHTRTFTVTNLSQVMLRLLWQKTSGTFYLSYHVGLGCMKSSPVWRLHILSNTCASYTYHQIWRSICRETSQQDSLHGICFSWMMEKYCHTPIGGGNYNPVIFKLSTTLIHTTYREHNPNGYIKQKPVSGGLAPSIIVQ